MMTLTRARITALVPAIVVLSLASPARPHAQDGALEPIHYTFRVIDPDKHLAGVEARVPTGGRPTIELMMPTWTPGYYVVEDYAGRVHDLTARSPDGAVLNVSKPTGNHWVVETKGTPFISVAYTLTGEGGREWVKRGAAFITLAERARRPRRLHRDAADLEAIGVGARARAGRTAESLSRARL